MLMEVRWEQVGATLNWEISINNKKLGHYDFQFRSRGSLLLEAISDLSGPSYNTR